MNAASLLIKFEAFNPRKNLPPSVGRKRKESNYATAFTRVFISERTGQGVGGRHFALSGYGIADFLWIDVKDKQGYPTLTAFEMKLKDWKRALGQAYRYSYFADHAVVVLPTESIGPAKENLNVFRKMGIGLWSFDTLSKAIDPIHHPKTAKPRNGTAKGKAVALLMRSAKFRNLLKESNTIGKSR